jgi:hypothetical protein
MSYYSRRQRKQDKIGSQKAPIEESVESKFGHTINVGDPVVTFTQSGRSTAVGAGVFKGTMTTIDSSRADDDHEWHQDWQKTYYIVERPDCTRTKLHFITSFCHRNIKLEDLIGHSI